MMTILVSSHKLDIGAVEKRMLTVKMSDQMLAEFHVAAKILRARNTSDLVHNFALKKIGEALEKVPESEFRIKVEEKLQQMQSRSTSQRKPKKQSQTEIIGIGDDGWIGLDGTAHKLRPTEAGTKADDSNEENKEDNKDNKAA